jgi:O-acetyl-ADP-ribose deacetylase (regulator of RNase III)
MIQLVEGDITEQTVDAIVNAANSSLLGGGGVDGTIHRMGGPAILEACRRLRQTSHRNGLPAGQAVITTAGQLAARHVIHTVGPVWEGGHAREAETLESCYRESLRLAVAHGDIHTLAFPSISTGVYRYPVEQAARVALGEVTRFLAQERHAIESVRFVLFDPKTFLIYRAVLAAITASRS